MKGGADVKLTIRATRHGPVLSDVNADLADFAGPGKAVALAFTGLGDRDTTAEAFMRVNAARNWDEFLDALRLYQTPTQNFVYADRRRRHRLPEPRLGPAAKVRRRSRPGRRRVGRLRLDRDDPVRTMAAAAQPGSRLRLQRQQRRFPRRSRAQFRAGLGREFPRPPHPAILRRDRQAQPGYVGRDAGRPPVSGRQGLAAVHRDDCAVGRTGAEGAGDASELERA